jgi:hypothetical protein
VACRSSAPFDEDPGQPVSNGAALAATLDLADFLCAREDIRLSTAALLSARFPFVSPSGRITSCGDSEAVAFVVDGGYLDTSGASPVVELMDRLGPLIDAYNSTSRPATCVVPFLIQIDNGPPPGAEEKARRPLELNVPLKTLFETRLARAASARNSAALAFTSGFPEAFLQTANGSESLDRYAHFFNVDAPGPRPPLGWVMSSFSREELLRDRFRGPNPAAFDEVRAWLGGDPDRHLTCAPKPQVGSDE